MNTSPEDLGYVLIKDSKDYYVNNRGDLGSKYANGNFTPLTPTKNAKGFLKVNILHENGERLSRTVHLLVAEAFIGPQEPGMKVKHKNGIITDNRVENLEYVMKASGVPRICLNCQKEFRTTDLARVCCNFKCQAEHEGLVWNCKNCDKEFTPLNKYNTYCCTECREQGAEKNPENYQASRFVIFKRDDFTCVYCGDSPKNKRTKLHLDHVFPRSMGGGNDLFNLVTACSKCNLQKSNDPLTAEQTLEIWERNQRLNEEKGILDYNGLKDIFEKTYKPIVPST